MHYTGMAKCESPFEEWIATHNGIADSLAVCRSDDRPCRFTQLYFAMFQRDKFQSFQTNFCEHSDRIQWRGKREPFVQFSWYSFNWHGSCTLCTKLRIPSWVSAIFVRIGFELMTSTIKLLFRLVFLGSLLVFWRLLRCSSLFEIPRMGTGPWWFAALCSKGLICRESFKRCFGIFAGTGAKALQCARISTDQHLEWPFLWHLLKASARHSGNCTWKPVHFHSPEANPALQRFGQTSGLDRQTCLLRHCRRSRRCRAQGTWKGVRAKHSEIDPILPIFTPPLHGPNMWVHPLLVAMVSGWRSGFNGDLGLRCDQRKLGYIEGIKSLKITS